jgi:hypothetical protein
MGNGLDIKILRKGMLMRNQCTATFLRAVEMLLLLSFTVLISWIRLFSMALSLVNDERVCRV